MEKQDAEGAAAAAEYFIEMYDYVMKTGDSAEWDAMSHETCGSCEEMIQQAVEIRATKATVEGGETTASVTQRYERDSVTGIFPLDVSVDQAPMRITSPDGSVLLDTQQTTTNRRVEAGLVDGQWVIVEIAPLPEG
jgi:hypothetical protein